MKAIFKIFFQGSYEKQLDIYITRNSDFLVHLEKTNSKNQRDKLQNTLEEENNKKCIPHQFSFVYNNLKEVVL